MVAPKGTRYLYGDMAVVLMPGAASFIRYWNQKSVPVAVVTNQQGVAMPEFPLMTDESVCRFNTRLNSTLADHNACIDEFFICPHLALAGCECRKPKPGLILKAIDKFKSLPERTWVIGDKESDVLAGRAANANAILLGGEFSSCERGPSAQTFEECLKVIFRFAEGES